LNLLSMDFDPLWSRWETFLRDLYLLPVVPCTENRLV
jgi:hypothetical protein